MAYSGLSRTGLGRWLHQNDAPLQSYLAEKPLSKNPLWNAFTVMMNIVAPGPNIDVPPLPGTKDQRPTLVGRAV